MVESTTVPTQSLKFDSLHSNRLINRLYLCFKKSVCELNSPSSSSSSASRCFLLTLLSFLLFLLLLTGCFFISASYLFNFFSISSCTCLGIRGNNVENHSNFVRKWRTI
ncbi:hypothetical protein DERP_005691 [Dermatophagoides pteronyssinus]|uniref:Transmembrane protein n=1 Tax=Dermatophagoides pteronyssinus TaxID=6956 RepID=A0ABQ8J9X6_DERPT|nr:hypothetical protein DERP_005691 [Dermatophagoides pteronyssinus]